MSRLFPHSFSLAFFFNLNNNNFAFIVIMLAFTGHFFILSFFILKSAC